MNSEREFRKLAENLPVAVIRYDSEQRRRYLNPVAEKMLHATTAELLGHLPGDPAIPAKPEMIKYYRDRMAEVLVTGKKRELDFVLDALPADQQEYYEVRFVPEQDASGQVIGVLAIWYDITERKEVQFMLERSQAELRRLAAHHCNLLEDERRLITYEMHEELAQALAVMRIKMSQLRNIMCDDMPAAKPLINDMLSMTENAIHRIRYLVGSMRPTTLDIGIVPTLEWLVVNFTKSTGILCQLQTPPYELKLADAQVTLLFRLVQEALKNVIQHAEANRVDITLVKEGNHYILQIEDDGRGICPEDLHEPGFGIIGMREQANSLGGVFTITPRQYRGTTVRVRFPRD